MTPFDVQALYHWLLAASDFEETDPPPIAPQRCLPTALQYAMASHMSIHGCGCCAQPVPWHTMEPAMHAVSGV